MSKMEDSADAGFSRHLRRWRRRPTMKGFVTLSMLITLLVSTAKGKDEAYF